MGKTQHTPGPWKVEQVGKINVPCVTAADDELVCFEIKTPFRGMKEAQANARLISAAPELLAAAKMGLEWGLADTGGIENDDTEFMRAAIIKAEGAQS